MTWPPGSPASTVNIDSGTDSPGAARSDILQIANTLNDIRAAQPRTLAKSANYTVVAADVGAIILVDCAAGEVVITLPDCAVVGNAFPLMIRKKDTTRNVVKIVAPVSNYVNGEAAIRLSHKREHVHMYSDGVSDWLAMRAGQNVSLLEWDVDITGATSSAAAIQRAINEAHANGGYVLDIPSHAKFSIDTLLTHKAGASFRGGQGNETSNGGSAASGLGYPRFYWTGADGGIMFQTDYSASNLAQEIIERCVFQGGVVAGNHASTLWDIKDRVDWGFKFLDCQWSFCTSHAIILQRGASNMYWYSNRWDQVGTGIRTVNNAFASHITIEKGHFDTGSTADWCSGFISFDATAAQNNVVNRATIRDMRWEVNSHLAGNHNMIDLGCLTTVSQKIQHRIQLENIYVPTVGGVTDTAIVGCYYPAATGPSDQISVVGININHSTSVQVLIRNTATPGPDSTKYANAFFFDPYAGSPITERGRTTFIGDVYFPPKTLVEPPITFAVNDLSPDVSGGNLFVMDNSSVGSAVYVGNFDGGTEGQTIKIIIVDTNSILSGGTNFKLLNGATSYNDRAAYDSITFTKIGTAWVEIQRSPKKYPAWIGLVDGGTSDPSPPSGVAALYVSSVDGDHKIKFSGGPTVLVVAD